MVIDHQPYKLRRIIMGFFKSILTTAGSVSKTVVKKGAKAAQKGVKGGVAVGSFAKKGRRSR